MLRIWIRNGVAEFDAFVACPWKFLEYLQPGRQFADDDRRLTATVSAKIRDPLWSFLLCGSSSSQHHGRPSTEWCPGGAKRVASLLSASVAEQSGVVVVEHVGPHPCVCKLASLLRPPEDAVAAVHRRKKKKVKNAWKPRGAGDA